MFISREGIFVEKALRIFDDVFSNRGLSSGVGNVNEFDT